MREPVRRLADLLPAASCRKVHASTVSRVRGITSAAEKNAPNAMWIAGEPL